MAKLELLTEESIGQIKQVPLGPTSPRIPATAVDSSSESLPLHLLFSQSLQSHPTPL